MIDSCGTVHSRIVIRSLPVFGAVDERTLWEGEGFRAGQETVKLVLEHTCTASKFIVIGWTYNFTKT